MHHMGDDLVSQPASGIVAQRPFQLRLTCWTWAAGVAVWGMAGVCTGGAAAVVRTSGVTLWLPGVTLRCLPSSQHWS